ncbi:unnamed protein product [Nesidiocoris tenuis]|uniref:Uncharacterized protein n=1 Tax=Nesidiocoris tenuis TaxID=355587 RepID=A0A6H5GT91_9HEMI|nr:unnamed protein product [Nesidiocoris tenuis]
MTRSDINVTTPWRNGSASDSRSEVTHVTRVTNNVQQSENASLMYLNWTIIFLWFSRMGSCNWKGKLVNSTFPKPLLPQRTVLPGDSATSGKAQTGISGQMIRRHGSQLIAIDDKHSTNGGFFYRLEDVFAIRRDFPATVRNKDNSSYWRTQSGLYHLKQQCLSKYATHPFCRKAEMRVPVVLVVEDALKSSIRTTGQSVRVGLKEIGFFTILMHLHEVRLSTFQQRKLTLLCQQLTRSPPIQFPRSCALRLWNDRSAVILECA